MTVNIGDVVKAVVEMVLPDGTIAQNVFHYRFAGDEAQLDDDVKTAIGASLDNLYDDITTWIGDGITVNPAFFNIVSWSVELGKWTTDSDLGIEDLTWAGESIGDPMPNQMAAVLTAATARPKARGRKFFPLFVETSAIGGELIQAAQDGLAAAGVDWLANLPLGGSNVLIPIVPSSVDGGELGLQSVEVNSIMGTQRRRKPGVGA